MAFTPLHDRVLVRRIESDEKTSGGLIIPESAKEKPAEGEIVSCGAGARKDSVVRHRSEDRRRRPVDHERKRHPRHPLSRR